jgi:hypothetical protein
LPYRHPGGDGKEKVMKVSSPFRRGLAVLLANACLFPVPVSMAAGRQASSAVRPARQVTPARSAAQDVFRVKDDSGKEFEVLRGREALGHLKNLKAKSPKAFASAEKDLSDSGFTPTEHVLVIRSIVDELVPIQTVESSAGEIVFWSWDDADTSTWEGTMYATKYATGEEAVNDGQVDVHTNQVLWERLVYETPRQRYQTTGGGGRAAGSGPYVLAANKSVDAGPYELLTAARPVRPRIRDWVSCVVGGCVAVAYGCVLANVMYPECLVLSCAGVKVGCTYTWIMNNWP